ncbi:MAG: ABC transporter ATP-binding protein [Ruminococcaceae bacterium]|nr:ABC transporter ATP-binding protein [Oscillospiraceae bacterium]
MDQSSEKRTFTLREELRLLIRAVKTIHQILPGFWLYSTLSMTANTVLPYWSLYLSAEIINELSGNCDPYRLMTLVILTIVGGFLLSTLARFFESRKELSQANDWPAHSSVILHAQNHFEYRHLEDPDVAIKRGKIYASLNAFNGGLLSVCYDLQEFVSSVLHLIITIVLTVPLFVMTLPGGHGFIHTPVPSILVIALVIAASWISIGLASRRSKAYHNAVEGLAELNVCYLVYKRIQGVDLRLFGLNKSVIEQKRKHEIHPEWLDRLLRVRIKYKTYSFLIDSVLTVVVLLFVAAKAFAGIFGIGNFILYQGTIRNFVVGVSQMAAVIGIIRQNNTCLADLFDYLDLPNEMYRGTLAVEKRNDLDYEIEFRDVSFKYPRTEAWALRHVNMKFKIGDKLAIVGENGSGKTTFIKLLCRLYDPTEGVITLNGIDITRYRYVEYMALFSVVFQDHTLFGFSLGDNVAAGHSYDAARARDCLVRAGLGDKLAALDADAEASGKPALDRAVGREYDSGGIDFSGGELQKIALARALYKDAPFVILDEPTAALDPIAEAAVYENFNRLVREKTAVFISHRLSSCRFCDSIAIFDRGELIQQGSHDELCVQPGKYSELWNAQAQYYV